jgi:large subunit ribosomal protein L29
MATATELRELDFDELESRLSEAKRELFNLRFQVVTGQLDNVSRIRQVRRDVARIRTILREQEIAAADAIEAATGRAGRPDGTAASPAPALVDEGKAGPGGRPEDKARPAGRPEGTEEDRS